MKIERPLLVKLQSHGERTYPEECCGILVGTINDDDPIVREVIEIDNSQEENRRRRFFVTPEQYRRSEELADQRGMTLLGFYHSHPDHPAFPSAFDTDHALPWFTYVIVSVLHGHAGKVTAWLLQESRTQFDERPMEVLSASKNRVKEKSWQ